MTPEQNTHAIIHNAADRALSSRGYWVPLSMRTAIAETVLAALAEHGLVVVAQEDLAETVNDAHAYDVEYRVDLDRPSAGPRLDRLRAVLSGTLHTPHGPEIDSALPGTHGHAGTPPNPHSDRTSPLMRISGPIDNPRNENQ